MESLVQPDRRLTSLERAEELSGALEVPEYPEISTGYADIYHGIWGIPRGERIEVAIKELNVPPLKSEHSNPEAVKRRGDPGLPREVFVWKQIIHPNLHPVLGYRLQPRPRLISPWCRHGNLTDYLRENPSLSRIDKLRLIYQAACGLEHLHSQKYPICHADIKPENVLINDRREAALSDFGLGRVLESLGALKTFRTGEGGRGHFNYMAGELFSGQKTRPDRESDVYAFGGLILTAMSGKPPFFGLPDSAILLRAMQNHPPKPEDHPYLSPLDPLWGLMRRCWNNVPEERPTMREVLVELWRDIRHQEFNALPGTTLLSVADDPESDFAVVLDTCNAERFSAIPYSDIFLKRTFKPIEDNLGRENASKGSGESKDFVVVILSRYSGWTMATNEGQYSMELNTVSNDLQILLECLQYKHGENSRKWYFVTDFETIFTDESGVRRPLPRATIPGTDTVVLPTRAGILAILQEASREGGSGFVHCGVHCRYSSPGVSSITMEKNETRYTEVSGGLPTAKETFIIGTDGRRLYGGEFIECLSDGDEKRCDTTLTLSFDMCNATEFLAGMVDLPYRYPDATLSAGANHLTRTTRPTNQLVVISATQPGQVAGTYRNSGALTYLLATALVNGSKGQQALSAMEIARYIHGICQTQPNPKYRQTPQIASRYPLMGSFRLLPDLH